MYGSCPEWKAKTTKEKSKQNGGHSTNFTTITLCGEIAKETVSVTLLT